MMTWEKVEKIMNDAKECRKTLEEMIVTAETEKEVETYKKCFMCYADGIITALKVVGGKEEEHFKRNLNIILANYQEVIDYVAQRKIGSLYNSGKTA